MQWQSPYLEDGVWLRGNTHTHTTVCGGSHTAQEVAEIYGRVAMSPRSPIRNYRFLVITDHNRDTKRDQYMFDKVRVDGLTLIEGREETYGRHVVGVNCPMRFDEDPVGKPPAEYTLADHQKVIDAIVNDGGYAILAHPHWSRKDYWPAEFTSVLERYNAIEIINGDIFSGPAILATDVWDAALTAGKRVWGVGADDFHSVRDFHNAWTYVYARDDSKEAVMEALHRGSLYASNGASFERLYADGDWIIAECDRESYYEDCEKTFRFIGAGGQIRQVQQGRNHMAAYKAQGDELYIRVELSLNWGYSAFASPFFLVK